MHAVARARDRDRLRLLLPFLLVGCAALRGQEPYDGPPGALPVLEMATRTIAGFGRWREVHLVSVSNPTETEMVVTLRCSVSEFQPVRIPPRTRQSYALDRFDRICRVTDWRVER